MQGICHLLTNIGIYCKEAISSCSSYELRRLDDSGNDLESLSEYENMDLNLVFKKINEEMEARKRATERVSFHLHLPKELSTLVEGSFIRVKHVFVIVSYYTLLLEQETNGYIFYDGRIFSAIFHWHVANNIY